jgi:hypothetical protein
MLGRNMPLTTIPRETFLALIQAKSTTLAQRIHTREAAFAFGLTKPPHTNEYLYPDAFAAILASAINRVGGIDLKPAAEIVRERWPDWHTLLTRAESFPHIEQYVCVAHTTLDRTTPPHIVMGTTAEIEKVLPPGEAAPCMIPIRLLLRCLRENARRAGIALPERLTVDPADEPAYSRWRAEIEAYREAAGARVAKTKPAQKRLLKA